MPTPNIPRHDSKQPLIQLESNPFFDQMETVRGMEAARLGLDVRTATWDIILAEWKIECQRIQAGNDERKKAEQEPLEVPERFLMETGELGTETVVALPSAEELGNRPTIVSKATAAQTRNWSIITTTVPDWIRVSEVQGGHIRFIRESTQSV